AAAMARRVSDVPSAGTVPMTAPVAGSLTGSTFPPSAPIQTPSTNACVRNNGNRALSFIAFRLILFLEKLTRGGKRTHACWNPAIRSRMQDRLANFGARQSIRGRDMQVSSEFLWSVERGEYRNGHQATAAAIQRLARPDLAPYKLEQHLARRYQCRVESCIRFVCTRLSDQFRAQRHAPCER